MDSAYLVKKFSRLREEPPFLIFQALLDKVPGRPLNIARFYLLALTEHPRRDLRGFGQVRKGTREDIGGMCALEDKRETFFNRFRDGEECVVACDGERIVGYMWLSCKTMHVEGRFGYRLRIPADSVYTFDGFIHPAYRVRGVWPLLQKFTLEQATALGRPKIITMVDFGNDPSLKAHLRFGFRIQKEVLFVSFLTRKLFRERTINKESAIRAGGGNGRNAGIDHPVL